MRSRTRLVAAIVLAAICAPGTWLRTENTQRLPSDIAMEQIAGPSRTQVPGWQIGGVWHYQTGADTAFGGFSAMLALDQSRLLAFSDRGYRFTFTQPDSLDEAPQDREIVRQLVAPENAMRLWDIESATRDPETGDYWLGFEFVHTIHRFSESSQIEALHNLQGEVDWGVNGGAEAMVRLADGRFVIVPEGRSQALVYPFDPAQGAKAEIVDFDNPAQGYAVTDMAQLPDGRLLLLMRDVVWGLPPFGALIAIADPPRPATGEVWTARVVLRFDGVIPPENYEALAVRPRVDGKVDLWVMSDDNFSVMQRTLLVKLVFDPGAVQAVQAVQDAR